MANEAEQLLAAEQAVQTLLEHLAQLQREIEGNANARASLQDTQARLADLTDQIKQLAEQSHLVIGKMGEVGTPEVLSRLNSVSSLVEEVSRDLKTLEGNQRTWQSQVLPAVETSIASITNALGVQQAELTKTVSGQGVQTEEHLKTLSKQSKKQAWFLAVLLFVAILLTAGDILLKYMGLL